MMVIAKIRINDFICIGDGAAVIDIGAVDPLPRGFAGALHRAIASFRNGIATNVHAQGAHAHAFREVTMGIDFRIAPFDTSALAWEFLRRNPTYRASVPAERVGPAARHSQVLTILTPEASDTAARVWGLHFRRAS
jgi:hypothetical protein